MHIWRRLVPAEEPVPPPAPIPVRDILAVELGGQYCSSRGCVQQTGLACGYVDRHQRACPTAWCPEHRYITRDAVYCPTHGRFLDGTEDEFRDTVHADIGNAVPMTLARIVQEVDATVTDAITRTAAAWHQTLVIDPVRFNLVGVDRVRTWERAWKVCDNLGPTLRVAVAIEEAAPDVAEARVQSQTALQLPIPWQESQGAAEEAWEGAALEFRQRLLRALVGGVADWQREHAATRATDLAGMARRFPNATLTMGDPDWPIQPPSVRRQ
jgi:hypothetical protein